MDKLTNAITDFYIHKSYVPNEKREIYSYGFKLIMADVINFAIIRLYFSGAAVESEPR